MKVASRAATRECLLKALECAQLHNIAPMVALEILSAYDSRVAAVALDDVAPTRERSAEIDRLYHELQDLRGKIARDPSLEGTIEEKLSRLRLLQTEEAIEMRRRFEARLPFKPGAGRALMDEAKRLLADDRSAT